MENNTRYFEQKFSEGSFQSLMRFIKIFALLCSLIGFCAGILIYTSENFSPINYTSKFEQIYVDESDYDKVDEKNKKVLDVKTLFDLKYSHYLRVSTSLGSIQKGIIAILIIAFMVLIFGAREIPFFGFTIPDTLIYIVVYFGGLYLLANFGLTFNALIENRLSLNAYINQMEEASGGICYDNSIRHLLSDSSLGDNWFGHYFNAYGERTASDEARKVTGAMSWLGLYGIYAILIGLFQGVILTTTIEFLRRKKLKLKYAYFMISFVILMYLVTAASFVLKFNYAAFWIAAICTVLTL